MPENWGRAIANLVGDFWTILTSGQFRHADYAWLHLRSRYFAALALPHYLLVGESQGFRPTPLFDPDFFTRHHSVTEGHRGGVTEGHRGGVTEGHRGGVTDGAAFAAFLRQPVGAPACEEYDEAFYLADNPELAGRGLPTWAHCQAHMLSELRDPSKRLSSAFVMMAYNAKPKRRARALLKLFEERRGPRRLALPLLEAELRENQSRFRAGIELKILRDGPRRHDNLVFVQTDGRHPHALRDAARNYDLLLNYYAPPHEAPPSAEYVVVQAGTKVTAIDKLLSEQPEILSQYDYVLFLDDDIVLSAKNIDLLFSIMREQKLDLAQPSLTPDSYGSFPVLYQNRKSPGFRRLNYVEIMAPAFSRRALVANKDNFSKSISGFSVDALVGAHSRKTFGETVAVIDAVAAEHKRPIDLDGGALYRFLTAKGIDPRVEMHVLEAEAGLEHGLREV